MATYLMICAAVIVGFGRGWEEMKAPRPDPRGHAIARVVLVAMLFAWAALSANSFTGFLFGALTPLGAFYAARALFEGAARANGYWR